MAESAPPPPPSRRRPVFDEVSDSDSIATDTTAGSEYQAEYGVERVLGEAFGREGTSGMWYLIKWEGYPLSRASWEPAENLGSDEILADWEAHKAAVRAGTEVEFDTTIFDAAEKQLLAEKAAKKARRTAKKERRQRRRAEARAAAAATRTRVVLGDSDDEIAGPRTQSRLSRPQTPRPGSSGKQSAAASSNTQPGSLEKQSTSSITKKGIVRPVSRSISKLSDSDEDGEIHSDDSGVDSLFGEPRHPTTKPKHVSPRSTPAPLFVRAEETPLPDKHIGEKTVTKAPTSIPAPMTAKKSSARPAPESERSQPMGQSVPKKQRARVTGETPKDSSAPQFRTLREQAKYQKYGAQNEPPPDPNKLIMLDPKTGKQLPSTAPKVHQEAADRVLDTSGRRSPPRIGRQREPSPSRDSSKVKHPSEPDLRRPLLQRATTGDAAMISRAVYSERSRRDRSPSPLRRASTSVATLPSKPHPAQSNEMADSGRPRKSCRFWANNNSCRYSADVCIDAHAWADPKVVGPSNVVCHFWRTRGACAYTGGGCKFAHADTGYYPRPPGFNEAIWKTAKQEVTSPPIPKRDLTCWFWKNDVCRKPVCEYAHRDTGNYASRPGTHWKEQPHAKRPDVQTMPSESSNVVDIARLTQPSTQQKPLTSAHISSVIERPEPEVSQTEDVVMADAPSPSIIPSAPPPAPMVVPQVPPEQRAPLARPSRDEGRPLPHTIHAESAASRQPDNARRDSNKPSAGLKADIEVLAAQSDIAVRFPARLVAKDPRTMKVLTGLNLSIKTWQTISASDFEAHLWDERLQKAAYSEGQIVVDIAHAASAETIAEFCKLCACGLIGSIDPEKVRMIIFPNNAEEWKFFGAPDGVTAPTTPSLPATLRFRILPDVPGLRNFVQSIDATGKTEFISSNVALGTELLNLDVKRLLEREPGKRFREVFLMIPFSHYTEYDLCARFFQDQGCRVYHSGQPGGWDYFRSRCSKFVLIVHPDVQLERIPRLYETIAKLGNGVQIFSIGVDFSIPLPVGQPPSFQCQRLFPYGSVYYLTDEAILYYPEETLKIVQFIHGRTVNGGTFNNSKIVCRANVKKWLLDKIIEEDETRYIPLYGAFCQLCPLEDEDPDEPGQTLPHSALVPIDDASIPRLQTLTGADRLQCLVNWFAGWAIEHVNIWRFFIVCYKHKEDTKIIHGRVLTEKDPLPAQWTMMYGHVGVATPQEVLRLCASKSASASADRQNAAGSDKSRPSITK